MQGHFESTLSPAEDSDIMDSEEDDNDTVEDLPEPSKVYSKPNKHRQSVSAEAYGAWNKKSAFTAPVHPKTEEQKNRIRKTIANSFLFNSLEDNDLKQVIDAFEDVRIKSGVTIIHQGEDGDKLYLIENGEVDVYKVLSAGEKPKFMTKMISGDAFGELALMYNAPRAATVKASTDMQLWGLDRQTFNHIVKDAAARQREMYESFLKEVDLLKEMDPYERSKVSDALKSKSYAPDETVIEQGETGDTFYILVQGNASAYKDGENVMDYKTGDYFGELALLRNQPRAATVKAKKDGCKVAYMDRKSFKRLLGPVEDILQRNTKRYTLGNNT